MIENLLKKNRWLYIAFAVLIVLYLRADKLILGMPMAVTIITILMSGIIALSILYYFSNKKKKNQALHFAKTKIPPKPKKPDIVNNVVDFLGAMLFSLVIFVCLKIVFNYAVIFHADKNHMMYKTLPIETYFSGRHKSVTFYFEGERYSLGFNAGKIPDREIERNYKIELQYSRSYFGSAVIDTWDVVRK